MTGQAGDCHTSGGAVGQGHGLAECPAVYVSSRAVLGVEAAAIHGAVVVVSVKMLEAEGIGVIRHQLIINNVIAEIQASHLSGREGGAVAPVLEFIVIDLLIKVKC